jgi:molybdopterin converting factor small subunit
LNSEAYGNPWVEPAESNTAGLDTAPTGTVKVRVELFGTPRLRAGCREVPLHLPSRVHRSQVVEALAQACPALVGTALREDLTDLQAGYVFNHNGLAFLEGAEFILRPGDSLLLISSQAGG